MPLSEQEQRLLEEMERSLYQNEADFVATVSPRRGKTNYSIVLVGILVAVLGIATLVTGVVVHQPLIGVLGFAIMFIGVLLAVAPPRRSSDAQSSAPSPRARRSSGFMNNVNDRWDKRQDGSS